MVSDTTKVITATEFKKNLGKYLDYVAGDNEVVITKNGHKIVRITPYITAIERYFTVREKVLDHRYGGKKVSYEEFMEIYEKSDLRMEYINGEIVLLESPSVYHQVISGNLYILLHEYFKSCKCRVFFAPFDVHFYKQNYEIPDVMQPDLLVACDVEETVNEKGRYMGTPTLCIEIMSKSTRSKDMIDKLNIYRLSGVKEFWLVDPEKKTVLLYGFKDYEIDEYTSFSLGDSLTSYYFKGLELPLGAVFAK